VAGRLDRVEVILGDVEIVVPAEAVHYAADDGGTGNVGAQLKTESVQPVADQPDVQQPGHVPGVPWATVQAIERRQVRDA